MATEQQIAEWRAEDERLLEDVNVAERAYEKRKRQLAGLAERGEGGEKANARMLLLEARAEMLECAVAWLVHREMVRVETGLVAP